MKILSLGLEQLVLDKNSAVAQRILSYGVLVDKYTIVVPYSKNKMVTLSDKVQAFGVGGNSKIVRFFNIYKFARQLLDRDQYDLITVQDQYYLAALGLLLAKKHKVALEVQVHGIEKYGGWRRLIANYVLPKADIVRTVSERLKRHLINSVGVDEKKVTVVPIFTEKNNIAIAKNYELKNPIILLTICRLVPIKNVELQIKAVADLKKENFNIELWIVGDGPEKNRLKEIATDLGVEENIKFFGWQEGLEKFYQPADLFILTSNYEGWGMVVIEAANYGLPIVMTDVGCAGEVIKNGESVIVAPVGDLEKIKESLRITINNEELRIKLGKNAKIAIQNLPTKEETLKLYMNSWDKAIHNAKLKNDEVNHK